MTPKPSELGRLTLRLATSDDASLVFSFMQKLGAYQKMLDEVTSTEQSLRHLIESGQGSALLGYCDGKAIGLLFFNQTSSAFTGRTGLFVDALYVEDGYRHLGFGRLMMQHLCALAQQKGDQFVEWGCLDWNSQAIAFYFGMGAYSLDTMRVYRLSPDSIAKAAAGS